MKSIYLSLCLLLFGFNSISQTPPAFHHYFIAEIIPTSTVMNLNSGNSITTNIVLDPSAYLGQSDGGNTYYNQVEYSIEYILVDQVNGNEFSAGLDNLYANGRSTNSGIPGAWDDISLNSSVVLNNCVPSGTYDLKIKMVNVFWWRVNSLVYFPYGTEPMALKFPEPLNDIRHFDLSAYNQNSAILEHCDAAEYNVGNPLCELLNIAVVNITNPTNVISNISSSTTFTACNSNTGTATINPVNGAPYTYLWSNGQNTQTATNLSVGSYDVIVTDVNGCSITEEDIIISYPYNIIGNLTTQQPCTFDEGVIYTAPSGGVAPYTYAWSSGQQTQNIEGVIQDTYTVTITDINGCVATETTTLTNQAGLGNPTYYDYPNGLTITNGGQSLVDADNDGKIRFRGTLIIKSGVHYTITNEILEFARDLYPDSPDQGQTHSGVIVEEGAKLTAANTTFKGVDACDAMWQGIQVWGEDYKKITHNGPKGLQAQLPNLNHGKFYPTNCVIQDAFVGIALYRVNMPFTNTPKEYGRGYVKAKYTNFLNNRVSVGFKARTSVVNTSQILQCNFVCNQPLIHPFKYNDEGSDIFISLLRVDKPQIKANTFTGHLAFTADKRATGIRSYASAYKVQSGNAGLAANAPLIPNTFNDLSQGIDIYAKGGGVKTIRIKDNRFNNVYQGIIGNGSNFDEISFNTFNIPMGEPFFNAWGIYLETASGFLATENTFNTLATNNLTFGFIAKDVDLINGEIYKNDFNGDFESATQAEGLANSQLQIDCNQYLGTNAYDWTILSSGFINQGGCLNVTSPSSNVFGLCSTSDNSQIYSVVGFTYSTNPGLLPNCKSATVLNGPCNAFLYDPAQSCPQIAININGPQYVNGLKNQFDNLPPGLERNKVKGDLIRELAKNGDTQGIIDVLTTDLLPEDKKILIPIHIKKEKYNEARNELNTLNIITTEDQSFYDLFDVLITIGETNRVLDEITIVEKQTIEYVANTQTAVAIQAQSVLAELNQSSYIRFPQQIPPTSSGMIVNGDNPTQNTFNVVESERIEIYPNPSSGNITIHFNQSSNGIINIIDMSGKTIANFTINDAESNYNIVNLAIGIYSIVTIYSDGSVDSKRIIIE